MVMGLNAGGRTGPRDEGVPGLNRVTMETLPERAHYVTTR